MFVIFGAGRARNQLRRNVGTAPLLSYLGIKLFHKEHAGIIIEKIAFGKVGLFPQNVLKYKILNEYTKNKKI